MFPHSFLAACILVVLIILRERGSLSMYLVSGHSASHSVARGGPHSSGTSVPPSQSGPSGPSGPMPKKGLPGWAIALICIGSFVVLCILMLLVTRTRNPAPVVPVQ